MAAPRPSLSGAKGSFGGRGRSREDQRKGGFGGGTVGGGGKGKGGGGGYSRPAGAPKGVGGQGALGNKKPPATKGSGKQSNRGTVAGAETKYLTKDRKRR